MEPIVSLRQVTKEYKTGEVITRALRGVDLDIAPGEFTAMVGPSGSGKSTLLNIIGGLDRPTSGEVVVDGQSVAELSDAQLGRMRRDRIGFIFQDYNLIPVLTAMENAEYVLMLQGQGAVQRHETVGRLLDQVGLQDLGSRYPRQMSGGQQQRVAIARAIASKPALVLADEPTANVDSKTATSLLEIMRALNRENNITFLFSTHDQNVMRFADRLIEIHDGKAKG